MTGIRALTLVLDEPSSIASALRDALGWTIESDFGSFVSLTAPGSIPLWINAPAPGDETCRGVVIHMHCDDVDEAFQQAIGRGALAVREPVDMDFGERSACVQIPAAPGVTFDFSRPLG